MSIKFNIFLISLLIGVLWGAELSVEGDSSSSSISEEESEPDYNELTPEDVLFRNLKELLRAGDEDFGVPIWAPFIDDNVVVEDLELPFKFMLDGFDKFEKVQTTIRENNTAEFQLFFPEISFFLTWSSDNGFIAVQGTQKNTTLIGAIEYEPQQKCIRLNGIDISLDYDTIDYDIVKRGDVDPVAEEFIFEYADFFQSSNKPEMLDAYEEMIEEEVEEVFSRLDCWTYTEEKLLSHIKNSI